MGFQLSIPQVPHAGKCCHECWPTAAGGGRTHATCFWARHVRQVHVTWILLNAVVGQAAPRHRLTPETGFCRRWITSHTDVVCQHYKSTRMLGVMTLGVTDVVVVSWPALVSWPPPHASTAKAGAILTVRAASRTAADGRLAAVRLCSNVGECQGAHLLGGRQQKYATKLARNPGAPIQMKSN